MKVYLRASQEFQAVYRKGERYDAPSMTAFVLISELATHRLGITASRKAIGNAVQRNRAKRLLRESFRLSQGSLNQLARKYDWVINAKRHLLLSDVNEATGEFQKILERVASREAEDNGLQLA